jgi:hypothetical protein
MASFSSGADRRSTGVGDRATGDDQYRNPDAVRQQLEACKLNGRSSIEAYARNAIASS